MRHDVVIVPMRASDWPAVAQIHQAGIATGDATFDTEPPSWDEFDAARRAEPRLVARLGEVVVGWAAVSSVSSRPVYAGVVEHSIFVDPEHHGRGVGDALLAGLVRASESCGIWTIQAHVFPENIASLRLHARHGFREVGIRRRLGRMPDGGEGGPARQDARWRDVVLIERRSESTGR